MADKPSPKRVYGRGARRRADADRLPASDRRTVGAERASSDLTFPVTSLQTWLKFARIAHGPIFRRVIDRGRPVADRLIDRHVARLVKSAALAAGVRGDLPESERAQKFAGHSLRAGLAQPALKDLYGVIMESSRKSTLSGVEELGAGIS
jgi:hypothetical protein